MKSINLKYNKSYGAFLLEKKMNENEDTDLFKIYLAVKRSSGHRWWTYKGFAADNYFIQITEENIDKVKVDNSLPILTYSTDIINRLLDAGKIKKENIINNPKFIKLSGSKKDFHEFIGEDENIPKTVYTQKAAMNLNFPIIAKPTSGHSGLGIQVFQTPEELKESDEKKFDLYSEFVDKKEEHRFINFKGKPIFWMERKPMNDKAKNGKGKADEQTMFQYIKRNVEDIPEDMKEVLTKFCDKLKDLPYICFDIMRDQDDKIYIIESNSQPGVPFDSTVEIYKVLFEHFYGRPVNEKTMKILDDYSKKLIDKTVKRDNGRFVDESKK
jgi:glutathione synthase/RimK-type ligase-like ATP-grasp enzyme